MNDQSRSTGPPTPSPQTADSTTPDLGDHFGVGLEPALRNACPALADIRWFRTTWQRGGALTGYGQWTDTNATAQPVVIKLPVPPQELRWLKRLQTDQHDAGDVVPQLLADGTSLGQYDLAWVVMEQLPHGPLDRQWAEEHLILLVAAAGRFYRATADLPVDLPPRDEPWPDILKRGRDNLRQQAIANEQRWNAAIRQLQKKLTKALTVWNKRDTKQWCYGDLHPGNAMTRQVPPDGPALLFDLADVHAGNWIEDAVYLEHLFWGAPDRLFGHDPVKLIAQQRKAQSLSSESNWPQLANIRRALIAASAPAYPRTAAEPKHLDAALTLLEGLMGQLK